MAPRPRNAVLRWLRNGALAMGALLLLGAVGVYAYTEELLGRRYQEASREVPVPADAASIAEGQRLARLRGCAGGCHGKESRGGIFIDDPVMGRIVAPDLAAAARDYSPSDLDRIIRRGVLPDGRSVLVMPSAMFSHLDDADVGRIIAYLRSLEPSTAGISRESPRIGPLARIAFAIGIFEPEAVKMRRASAASARYPGPAEPTFRGGYLGRTLCTECHGDDLKGDGQGSPDLRVAAAYSREQFAVFMRTGNAVGGRELPLMSKIARGRFKHLTEDEIAGLHAYLLSRAQN